MAEMAEDPEFWPPPEFLTDYEILMDKANSVKKNGLRTQLVSNFYFPSEFPYDFGSSSALSSPVESTPDLTESEGDEEDLLAGLTRLLSRSTLQETQQFCSSQKTFEKNWVKCGSPKSTLMTVGSWSGRSTASSNGGSNGPSQVPSPPTSPLGTNNDAWDLIYQAAGEVARLKMNGEGPVKAGVLLGPPQILSSQVHRPSSLNNHNFGLYSNQRSSHTLSQIDHFQGLRQGEIVKQGCDFWGIQSNEAWLSQNRVPKVGVGFGGAGASGGFVQDGKCGRPFGLPQTRWPALQVPNNHHRQPQNQLVRNSGSDMRPAFLGASEGCGGIGVKRERAGTGVFLPRRYINPPESRKKRGCSTALIPAKVVRPTNKNFEVSNFNPQCPPPSPFSSGFIPDCDLLMVQKNAMLTQQKRSLRPEAALGHDICLPQEWTY